jgi:hypothetical protein
MITYDIYWTTGRLDFRDVKVEFLVVRADESLYMLIVLDPRLQLDSQEYQPLVFCGFFAHSGSHLTILE